MRDYNINNFELILLDLGNVLYEINMEKPYLLFKNFLQQHGITTTLSFVDFYQLQIFGEFERGMINSDLFHKKLQTYFNIEISMNELKYIWNSMLIGIYSETPEFLRNLVNLPCKLALLSNTNEFHYEKFYPEMHKILELFDRTFYSHKIGLAKPDNKCFEFVLNEFSIKPNRILYIDDTLSHIIAAKKLGYNVFHFNHKTNRKLLEKLLFDNKTKN